MYVCMHSSVPVYVCASVPACAMVEQSATVHLTLSSGEPELERQATLPSTHLCSKAPSKSGRNVSAAGRGPASECQSFSGQHREPACLTQTWWGGRG